MELNNLTNEEILRYAENGLIDSVPVEVMIRAVDEAYEKGYEKGYEEGEDVECYFPEAER